MECLPIVHKALLHPQYYIVCAQQHVSVIKLRVGAKDNGIGEVMSWKKTNLCVNLLKSESFFVFGKCKNKSVIMLSSRWEKQVLDSTPPWEKGNPVGRSSKQVSALGQLVLSSLITPTPPPTVAQGTLNAEPVPPVAEAIVHSAYTWSSRVWRGTGIIPRNTGPSNC